MNLTELLNMIQSHPKTLMIESTGDQDTDSCIFRRVTYTSSSNVAQQMVICILISNKNMENETAYIKGAIPQYLTTETFSDAVIAKIVQEKTALNIETYEITRCSNEDKIAELNAYVSDETTDSVTLQKYLAYELDNEVQLRKLA